MRGLVIAGAILAVLSTACASAEAPAGRATAVTPATSVATAVTPLATAQPAVQPAAAPTPPAAAAQPPTPAAAQVDRFKRPEVAPLPAAGKFQVVSQSPWPGEKVRVFFLGAQF